MVCGCRYAMREALAITAEEGLKEQWQRHEAMHHMLWDGLKSMGLKSFVDNDSERLITVNTIKVTSLSSVSAMYPPPPADCAGVLCPQPLESMLLSPLVYAHWCCCHCKADKSNEQAKCAFHGHEPDDLMPVPFGRPFWFTLWHEKWPQGHNCEQLLVASCQLNLPVPKANPVSGFMSIQLACAENKPCTLPQCKHLIPTTSVAYTATATTVLQHCPLVLWTLLRCNSFCFTLTLSDIVQSYQ